MCLFQKMYKIWESIKVKRIILSFIIISLIFTISYGTTPATGTNKEKEQFTYEVNEIYSATGSKGISSITMGNNGELALYNYYEKNICIFDKEGTKIREIEVGENWDGVLTFDKYNKLYVLLQSLEKKDRQENALFKRQLRIYDTQSNILLDRAVLWKLKGTVKNLLEK